MIKSGNPLRLVSYNICWEAMKGINLNHKNYATNGANIQTMRQQRELRGATRRNLVRYLRARINSDFILLQEAEGIRALSRQFSQRFAGLYHHSGLDKMCLLYDKKKYTPMKSRIVGGEFEKGRPFLIVPFKERKCIINVHLPHTQHLENKTMHRGGSVGANKRQITFEECMQKVEKKLAQLARTIPHWDKYQIIMGGDFNAHIPAKWSFIINKKNINNKNKTKTIKMKRYRPAKPTCCYLNSDKISYKWYLDQFYISGFVGKTKLNVDFPIRPLSDHLPIHLEISGD